MCEQLAEDTAKPEPFLGSCGYPVAGMGHMLVTVSVSAGQTRAMWFGLFGFGTI